MDKTRMLSALEQKISKNVGHRVDLHVADVRKMNNATAHFMVGYSDKAPTSSEISEFFIRQYEAKLVPLMSTARVYKGQEVVTVVAQILNLTRDVDDSKAMKTVIANALYLDVPMQETWRLEERDGKKVLIRTVRDDIMAIVQARKSAMHDSRSDSKKTFANVAQGSLLRYLAMLEPGDTVKFLYDDKIMEGEVRAASDNDVSIKCGDETCKVSRSAIIEVVSRSQEKQEEMNKYVEDYFTEAYGDKKYAKDLVK